MVTLNNIVNPLVAEPYESVHSPREACGVCDLCVSPPPKSMNPHVPKGWTKKLLIVGIVPKSEAHRWMKARLAGAGYEVKDVAFMPAIRNDYEHENEPTMTQLRCCRPFLVRALSLLRPERILACGTVALKALRNVGKGAVLNMRGLPFKVPCEEAQLDGFCTFHPDAVLLGATQFEPRILEDLKRASWPVLEDPGCDGPMSSKAVAVDFEYSPELELLTMGMSDGDRAVAFEYFPHIDMLATLSVGCRYIVGHNVAVDVDQLVSLNRVRPQVVTGEHTLDTFLLARMVDENRGKGGYRLDNLFRSYFTFRDWKSATEAYSETDATKWPPELREARCRIDAWATAKLHEPLVEEVYQQGIPAETVRLQHRIAMTLQRVHHAGMVIDLPKFDSLGEERRREVEYYSERIRRVAFQKGLLEFDPGNENHLRELLFHKLKFPVQSRSKKTNVPQTTAAVLGALSEHEIVQDIQAFKKANKVVNTWYGNDKEEEEDSGLVGLIKRFSAGRGLLPVNLIPCGTRTGRRASVRPNTQNWPEAVRAIVVSRWEGGKILNVDYSQLEPTILAWITGEKRMLDHFRSGAGYIGIGEDFFGKTVSKGTEEYRFIKSIVLGIGYGMGAWKLAHDLWDAGIKLNDNWKKHVQECDKAIQKYFRLFPKVERYIERCERAILKHGRIRARDGALRHLPCPKGRDTQGFKHLRNEAINYPIQRFASIITGCALLDCERALVDKYRGGDMVSFHKDLLNDPIGLCTHSVIVNEVHDSLIFDLHPEHIEEDTELVSSTMSELPTLRTYAPNFPLYPGTEHDISDYWRSK